jgi:D-aspartate ligase
MAQPAEATRLNRVRVEPGWPAVIVAGGFQTGVVLMRNLSRRGVATFCVDPDSRQPAFRTIYGKAYQCPKYETDPDGWLRFMFRLADQIGGTPVLIPSSDQFVSAIAAEASELEKRFIFCRSSAAVQGLLATKKRQYEIADSHGLPAPRTEVIRTAGELEAFAATAQFPCLLKPLHFREWKQLPPEHPMFDRKLVVADTAGELLGQYQRACEANPEMVAQEVIVGPDTAKLVYLSCYNERSERIGSCLLRQLRTDPIYFGSASVVEPVVDPEADRLCDQFLRSIQYVGLCEIELKRDSRDGKVKIIEANPRYSVTADAAPYAGVDLGWIHYLDLIGQPVEPVHPGTQDFRHIVLFRDLAAIPGYRREKLLTWRELLRSYRQPRKLFDFDWRDWRVTGKHMVYLAKILAKPLLARVFPGRRWSVS